MAAAPAPAFNPKVYQYRQRSQVIGLAKASCSFCGGAGIRSFYNRADTCKCVWRAIFRGCLREYRRCESVPSVVQTASWEFSDYSSGEFYKNSDFCADFELCARRVLDPLELRVLNLFFLASMEWKACCRVLKIDRGTFFHATYRLSENLGQALATTLPYSLWPIDEYMAA